MVVVIAPEEDVANELEILKQLFDAGLRYYHFRKPRKSLDEHRSYLNAIDEAYHKYIIPHYHHELAIAYNLKGVHLQEQYRKDLGDTLKRYFTRFKEQGFTVSSSYHEPDELDNETIPFDYHLLSPVFSSISKEGYEGRGFDVRSIAKTSIGMGGVSPQTIPAIINLGYQGVGVLGGVWHSEDPVGSFREIQRASLSICNKK